MLRGEKMSSISGLGLSGPLNLLLAFVVVLALIGVIAWAIRRFNRERLGSAARTRQPRLAVIDTAVVDARRQLIIIRRDNVEHLLMIGGASDVVIEANIVRASAVTAGRDTAARAPSVLDAPRTSPVYEGTSWPAPQPESSLRLQRSYPLDETAQWQPSVQAEPTLRIDKSAGSLESDLRQPSVRQEPSLRTARPASQDAKSFPAVSRDEVFQPQPPLAEPVHPSQADRPAPSDSDMLDTARPQPAPAASPAHPPAPPLNVAVRPGGRMEMPSRVQGGAEAKPASPSSTRAAVQPAVARPEHSAAGSSARESAGQTASEPGAKRDAGPRFSFPSLKTDRAPPLRTSPPTLKVDRPGGASTAVRSEGKPRSKSLYESLEQEMASLLGKPPEKP